MRSSEVYLGFAEPWVSRSSVDSAHRQPVIFLGRPSRFSSDLLLFFRFLTWLRLVLRLSAFSVTVGPVAGNLPQRSSVVLFRFAHLLLVSTLLRLPLQRPALFVAAGGVLAGVIVAGDFPVIGKSPEFQFPPFPTQKRHLKCYRARFVCFITLRGCWPVILLR